MYAVLYGKIFLKTEKRDDSMVNPAIKSVLSSMRKHNRRTVVQSATLAIGSYNIDCTAYDISLGGIRLKVDLPVAGGTNVYVQLKNRLKQTAKVIWSADGFMGLNFLEPPERVRTHLGSLSNGLN